MPARRWREGREGEAARQNGNEDHGGAEADQEVRHGKPSRRDGANVVHARLGGQKEGHRDPPDLCTARQINEINRDHQHVVQPGMEPLYWMVRAVLESKAFRWVRTLHKLSAPRLIVRQYSSKPRSRTLLDSGRYFCMVLADGKDTTVELLL